MSKTLITDVELNWTFSCKLKNHAFRKFETLLMFCEKDEMIIDLAYFGTHWKGYVNGEVVNEGIVDFKVIPKEKEFLCLTDALYGVLEVLFGKRVPSKLVKELQGLVLEKFTAMLRDSDGEMLEF